MNLHHTPIRPPRDMVEEQVYARRWADLMAQAPCHEGRRPLLEHILLSYPAAVDQRAASVAASFICWLGTNVGLSFLQLGHSIRDNTSCKYDAYVAAWGARNTRRFAINSGARMIEFLLRTEEQLDANTFPVVSANDLEVLEQVALWLGSEEGQAFLTGCEAEINRHRDMETLAWHHANGRGHLPYVKELEARFISKE